MQKNIQRFLLLGSIVLLSFLGCTSKEFSAAKLTNGIWYLEGCSGEEDYENELFICDNMQFSHSPPQPSSISIKHHWDFQNLENRSVLEYVFGADSVESVDNLDTTQLVRLYPAGFGGLDYEINDDTLIIFSNNQVRFQILKCSNTKLELKLLKSF